MSDPTPSPEELQQIEDLAVSRDQRLALIRQELDIEVDLRTSPTWRYIRHRVSVEMLAILDDLVTVELGNVGSVAQLQARAIAVAKLKAWPG
jgi:hypothetical protein